jgi:hypothetical protein
LHRGSGGCLLEDQDHARVSTATDHRSCPNLDLTFATVDARGSDGQSYRLRRKTRQIPFGPVYFTRDYVRRGFFKGKTSPQGRRGVVLEEHTLLGKVTHVDLRLPDGELLFEVPIDCIRAQRGTEAWALVGGERSVKDVPYLSHLALLPLLDYFAYVRYLWYLSYLSY